MPAQPFTVRSAHYPVELDGIKITNFISTLEILYLCQRIYLLVLCNWVIAF